MITVEIANRILIIPKSYIFGSNNKDTEKHQCIQPGSFIYWLPPARVALTAAHALRFDAHQCQNLNIYYYCQRLTCNERTGWPVTYFVIAYSYKLSIRRNDRDTTERVVFTTTAVQRVHSNNHQVTWSISLKGKDNVESFVSLYINADSTEGRMSPRIYEAPARITEVNKTCNVWHTRDEMGEQSKRENIILSLLLSILFYLGYL